MNATRNSAKILEQALSRPIGTILELWYWGPGGSGCMGRWLVGEKTLWDIEKVFGEAVTKSRHPSNLHTDLSRFTRWGNFRSLGYRKRNRILALLQQKGAERGNLLKKLKSTMKRKTRQDD